MFYSSVVISRPTACERRHVEILKGGRKKIHVLRTSGSARCLMSPGDPHRPRLLLTSETHLSPSLTHCAPLSLQGVSHTDVRALKNCPGGSEHGLRWSCHKAH